MTSPNPPALITRSLIVAHEVTQADRDAAALMVEALDRLASGLIRAGEIQRGTLDQCPEVQALARHRIAALSGISEVVKALEAACEEIERLSRYANNHGATIEEEKFTQGLIALDRLNSPHRLKEHRL